MARSAKGRLSSELEKLLERTRRHWLSDDEISIQRNSFAIGGASLERSSIARSSVVDEIPSISSTPPQTNVRTGVEVANLVAQYDFIVSTVREHLSRDSDKFALTSDLIRRLHAITLSGVDIAAGTYRRTRIGLSDSDHVAPEPDRVPTLLEELCAYITENWHKASSLHLSAYALWRLLWIHPFVDGNGRTARALCYLILCLKLRTLLPGTPTLPELIRQNLPGYYSALEDADQNIDKAPANVGQLEHFLEQLVAQQLLNRAELPTFANEELKRVIDLRVFRASSEFRRERYGNSDLDWGLWSLGPYLSLYISNRANIERAEQRQKALGEAFPKLFATQTEDAAISLGDRPSLNFFEGTQLDVTRKRAIYFPPDASLILIRCPIAGADYQIDGGLYSVRLGPTTTVENCYQTFDLLIARHLRASS